MTLPSPLADPRQFSAALYTRLQAVQPGIAALALYEFRYALENITPAGGWASLTLDPPAVIEERVNRRAFYDSIQIKPIAAGRIVLDAQLLSLTQTLLAGLVAGAYSPEWVSRHFYFDIRGFHFLHRSEYFTPAVIAHFGGAPLFQFEPKQRALLGGHDLGYQDFSAANAEVDAAFIQSVQRLVERKGTPLLLAIAGPTAAGKTEIVERLTEAFQAAGRKVTSIELDNFLTDRDEREAKGIFTQGKAALHFDLLVQALHDLCAGKRITIPRYDFVYATSSHDNSGRLKPDGRPIEIAPADIIFIEGNFPFLIEEVVPLISVKVVYLTDDPIRLLRKWKRDIDYRKKYEPTYFRNRYFKDQFIMAEIAYRPQLLVCDLCVDTTGAALWATPEMQALLGEGGES
jgi:uridine kinase